MTYRVIKLEISGFRRIKAMEIDAGESDSLVISGKNAQGKTSILDAITAALNSRWTMDSPDINAEVGTSTIRMEIGNGAAGYIMERTRSLGDKKTSPIMVKTKDGASVSATSFLNGLTNAVCLDPTRFVTASDRERLEMVKTAIGKEKFEELEKNRKRVYEERAETNRNIKFLKGKIKELYPKLTEEEIDDLPMADKEDEIQEKLRMAYKAESESSELKVRLGTENTRISDAKTAIKKAQEEIEYANKMIAEYNKKLAEIKKADKPEKFEEDLRRARAAADNQARIDEYEKTKKYLVEEEANASGLTSALSDIDTDIRQIIEDAHIKVPGFEITQDSILFDGRPFEQGASTAQKYEVAVAVGAAAKPQVGVILLRHGAFLDPESMKAVKGFARERRMQIWIERVSDGKDPDADLIIEDGGIAVDQRKNPPGPPSQEEEEILDI